MKFTRSCVQCGEPLKGRSDKRYCSLPCKNSYSTTLRRNTRQAVKAIDSYLHRNREILQLLMGDDSKVVIDRQVLSKAKFRWDLHTGTYLNKEGKTYYLVYDYAWMAFSDQKVLIVRKKMPA